MPCRIAVVCAVWPHATDDIVQEPDIGLANVSNTIQDRLDSRLMVFGSDGILHRLQGDMCDGSGATCTEDAVPAAGGDPDCGSADRQVLVDATG
jgi:hypothetical protein